MIVYVYDRFGDLTLSRKRPASEMGTPEAQDAYTDLPGGAFDGAGNEQARVGRWSITHKCGLVETTPQALQAAIDRYRGQIGKRERLYRVGADGAIHWILARLNKLALARGARNALVQDVSMDFDVAEYPWHGEAHGAWALDSGRLLDDGLVLDEAVIAFPATGNVVLANNGNYPVRRVVFTITAAGTNITQVTITKTGETALRWVGTLLVGNSLVIDCGAWTVKNNGVDVFSGFTRGAGHTIMDWLVLEPGNNTIELTRTGGAGSTVDIAYDDGWA